ncbi:MAG: tetratricopeptide repeat protein [Gammaproteobacteria bacterium]|nr:tetratricopeptide repeat protein [Gammaproteobacteria bacterium]
MTTTPFPKGLAPVSMFLVGMTAIATVVLSRAPDFMKAPVPTVPTHDATQASGGASSNSHDVALFPDALSPEDRRMATIKKRFDEGVYMLHAGRYDEAATAMHAVLLLSPRLVEAHVNMGYALLGLKRYKAADEFFRKAIDLKPYQGNAYWGLAEALEGEGDLAGALGAMRTYIHLAKPGDPYVTRARSALWEWDSRLKHGPPSQEAQDWMKRRQTEDAARNSPQQDAPPKEDLNIPLGGKNGG